MMIVSALAAPPQFDHRPGINLFGIISSGKLVDCGTLSCRWKVVRTVGFRPIRKTGMRNRATDNYLNWRERIILATLLAVLPLFGALVVWRSCYMNYRHTDFGV